MIFGNLILFYLVIRIQYVWTDLVIADPTYGLDIDVGDWDTKPTEENWRKLLQLIKIINSTATLIFIYMYHQCSGWNKLQMKKVSVLAAREFVSWQAWCWW